MKKVLFLAIIAFPFTLMAQEKEQPKEAEQIVITRKGDDSKKLNIVVDGDNITVNGKPISKEENADITVKRMKIKDLDNFQWSPNESFRYYNQAPFAERTFRGMQLPNKAMLGVVTEKVEKGARIVSVNENTAAAKSGLKEGDIITAVDSKPISSPDELSQALKDKKPGDKVTITYTRDGKKSSVNATLTKWEAPRVMTFEREMNIPGGMRMDFDNMIQELQNNNNLRRFQFRTNPDFEGPKLGVQIQETESGNGVRILSVESGSDAAKAGLKEGDIIKEANGNQISSAMDIKNEVANSKPGSSLNLKVERDGTEKKIDVQISKKLKSADI